MSSSVIAADVDTSPVAGLTTHAECVVSGTQIDEYRGVLRSAMATAHRRGWRDLIGLTASPLQPFLIAWTTFDDAVSTLTGLDRPTVVHLSQEIRQERPLVADEPVTLLLEVLGARRDSTGTRISFLSTLLDEDGHAFADLHTGLLAVGAERPGSFGQPRKHPVLANREWSITTTATIPTTLPARYAEVSEDGNPIHLDVGAAHAAGLDGVIAHGMSVVGLVTEEAIDRFADGDAERITGLGTRFSAPVIPGEPFEIEGLAVGLIRNTMLM